MVIRCITIITLLFLLKAHAVGIAPVSCEKNTEGMYYGVIDYIMSLEVGLSPLQYSAVYSRYELWSLTYVFDRSSNRSEFYTHMSEVNRLIEDTRTWNNQQLFDFLQQQG